MLETSTRDSVLRTASEPIGFDMILEAARQGDAIALNALEKLGVDLGIVMANLINLFNPEMIILGGVLGHASEFLMDSVETTINANALALPRERVKLVVSKHGDDTCVMGAATLVLDEILRAPAW
jgi:predicted NBD/HSP70 family sugar kinase